MKSNAPWSVKGIERDARETAKEAARREGMTVGEWLNRVIYTAGDPETSNGEIEGLKISDLVTAIEHLNKKVINAESKGSAAVDDLSRNFGGMVERLQRLERVRPGEAGPDLDARIERLEAKASDRQRIEMLRALEKAVSQVALQYETAHRQTLARLESSENRLKELADRIDLADAGGGRPDAAGAADAEFVERTGARLRVLGDEIKRGGDQMRALEASIRKFSERIDAAERRSSEGVAKVAETIAELKEEFGRAAPAEDTGGARTDVVAVAEKIEDRAAELRRSFDKMVARFGPSSGEAAEVREAVVNADSDHDDVASGFEIDVSSKAASDDGIDAFSFDLDEEPVDDAAAADAGADHDALDEIESDEPAQDGLDAILAELDTIAAPAPAEDDHDDDVEDDREDGFGAAAVEPGKAIGGAPGDYLKQARLAAREAAERGVEEGPRRRLTPRQRAILAAKIRRKRLAQQSLDPIGEPSLDAAPELSTFDEAPSSADERSSLAAKAAGALSGLKTRFYGPASDRALHREDGAAHKTTSPGPLGILAGLRSNPLTAALIVAVALAIAAVFFLIKDLLFAGVDPATVAQRPAVSAPAPMAPTSKPDVDNKGAEPATSGETIKPRALYLNSVAELKTAKTAAETSAAIAGIEQAAELGWPPAQLQLGELYKLGQGVPEDPAKARTWYERAANGGNVLAMHRAGVMEARGQGGPRDEAAAIAWFEKAGNFGLVDSQYNLGALYHPGGDNSRSGVQDAAKAYYWYSLAAKNGDQQAGALAASLASSLSPERLKAIDADIATWKATQPDADANEVAPAS